jgi:hypothetical protein
VRRVLDEESSFAQWIGNAFLFTATDTISGPLRRSATSPVGPSASEVVFSNFQMFSKKTCGPFVNFWQTEDHRQTGVQEPAHHRIPEAEGGVFARGYDT